MAGEGRVEAEWHVRKVKVERDGETGTHKAR